MTQPKSGYSSNIIVAIAALIILLGILDSVRFWSPLVGVKDMEALAKELDPMKPLPAKEIDVSKEKP